MILILPVRTAPNRTAGSGWTVAVEQSCSESRALVLDGKGPIAVMLLISQQYLAKLIETSTELLQSMSAASGGLARIGDAVASHIPHRLLNPRVGPLFLPL